jgi:Leucine-rich repeat (LRR) protein
VTVSDLAQFQNVPKVAEVVQVVNVSNCPKLRGKDLEAIGVPQNGKGCIRKLTFIQSGLDSIPDSLFPAHATTLQYLNLSANNLSSLPSSLSMATSLKDLDLSYNAFTVVPSSLTSLPHLQTLSLSQNSLATFDSALLTLPTLEYLYLSHNLIATFTEVASPELY